MLEMTKFIGEYAMIQIDHLPMIVIVYLQCIFCREAYNGCYPNVEEFVNCAFNDDPPSEKDLFHTNIVWVRGGMHKEDITINCRDTCSEIAATTSRYIPHVRVNYEGELDRIQLCNNIFLYLIALH